MATGKSWSIAVPITKEGGTWGYITVYFQEEYDAVNNYSTLKVTKITGSNTIRVGTFYTVGSISVDGSTWYSWNSNNWCFGFNSVGTSEFVTYSGATYPSGLVINHNDDGSKTINVSVTISDYWGSSPTWYGTGGTVSNSITLTPIPRASTISATDANIEAVSSIAVNRRSSAYTHSILYQFGSLSGYINADGSVSSSEVKLSATSIGFTIPSSFYAQIPNSKTGICTLTIKTYSGSTQIGDAKTCAFTVTAAQSNCAPSVSGTVVDVNETTLALTGDENKLVRFFSNALATIKATAKNAASIASKVIAGVEVSEDTRAINAVETASFAFAATDSRGYSNSATVTKTLIEYIKLTCNMTVARDDPTSGNATLVVKGDYFNGSFGAVSNALTVQYRIDGGSWVTVTPTLDGNTYAAIVALTGLDYQSTFDFEVLVSDKLMSVTKSEMLNKGIPNFHMGEDDVTFEVPVNIKGGLITAKSVAPRNLLDNSDFVNPVNQRGITSLTSATTQTYFFDRWYSARTTLSVTDEGLSFAWDGTNGSDGWIQQKLPNGAKWYGKTVTAAIEFADGHKYVATGIIPTTTNQSVAISSYDSYGVKVLLTNMANSDVFSIVIAINSTTPVVIKNISLYEGSYTAETLPPYVLKGYGVELLECLRYFWVVDVLFRIRCNQVNSSFVDFLIPLPVPMRAKPTFVAASEAYVFSMSTVASSGWTMPIVSGVNAAQEGYVMIRATKTSHGLADGWLNIPTGSYFSADL